MKVIREYTETVDGIEYLVREYESGHKVKIMKPETVSDQEQLLLEMAASVEYLTQLVEMNMEV